METTKTATPTETTASDTQVYRLEPPHGEHAEVAVRVRPGSAELLAWPSGERILAMVPGPGSAAAALAMWQGYTVAGDGVPAAPSASAEATIFSRADAEPAETDEPRPARKRKKGNEDDERDDDAA